MDLIIMLAILWILVGLIVSIIICRLTTDDLITLLEKEFEKKNKHMTVRQVDAIYDAMNHKILIYVAITLSFFPVAIFSVIKKILTKLNSFNLPKEIK